MDTERYTTLVLALRYCADYDCSPRCPRFPAVPGCLRRMAHEAADDIETLLALALSEERREETRAIRESPLQGRPENGGTSRTPSPTGEDGGDTETRIAEPVRGLARKDRGTEDGAT